MALNNSLAPAGKKTFSQALASESVQRMLADSIKDPKQRNKFTADITSYVASNKTLQECDFVSIIASAMQGNALNLSPVLGEYWVVPYNTKSGYKAQFQLGVQGRIQLALRSGEYKKLGACEIRQGEYKGRDSRTGEAIIEYIADDVEREKAPVAGYYAYFELLNGFFKSEYFSKEKTLQWAARYSKSFDRELYDRFIAGKVTDWKEQLKCSSPWYERFDTMGANTVLKQLLKWGPKSTEMRKAEIDENKVDDEIVGDLDIQFEPITTTAEEVSEEKPVKKAEKAEKTEKPKKAYEVKEPDDDDDFFGDNPFPDLEGEG